MIYLCARLKSPTTCHKLSQFSTLRGNRHSHFTMECLVEKNICSNCGDDHMTKDCPDKNRRYCASCKNDSHVSWDRECPEFKHRVDKMDDIHPKNVLIYFPTDEDWTMHSRPQRIKLDERFLAKYVVASLPPPTSNEQQTNT